MCSGFNDVGALCMPDGKRAKGAFTQWMPFRVPIDLGAVVKSKTMDVLYCGGTRGFVKRNASILLGVNGKPVGEPVNLWRDGVLFRSCAVAARGVSTFKQGDVFAFALRSDDNDDDNEPFPHFQTLMFLGLAS